MRVLRQRFEVIHRVVDFTAVRKTDETDGQQRGGTVRPESVIARRRRDKHIGNSAGI